MLRFFFFFTCYILFVIIIFTLNKILDNITRLLSILYFISKYKILSYNFFFLRLFQEIFKFSNQKLYD